MIHDAKFLAADFEEQYEKSGELGDALTEDIVTDWDWGRMKKGICPDLGSEIISLYQEIDENFQKAFYFYDIGHYYEGFWTLKGMKDHPLWQEQRKKAKELAALLENAFEDAFKDIEI